MLICIIGRAELIIAITQVLAQKSGVNEYFVTEYSFSFIYMEKCTTQCTSVNQLHVVCHASMTTPPTAPCTSGNCARCGGWRGHTGMTHHMQLIYTSTLGSTFFHVYEAE